MTKKLNPPDVLKAVETLIEQLQEELDDCADELGEALDEKFDQCNALEQERDELKARVVELENELEQERDTLRIIASDLGTRLSAAMCNVADGRRVETYRALRALKTTLDDLKNDARRLDQ